MSAVIETRSLTVSHFWLLQNSMYQIYPRIDVYACRHLEIDGGKGPTRRLLGDKGPQLTLVRSCLPSWVFSWEIHWWNALATCYNHSNG